MKRIALIGFVYLFCSLVVFSNSESPEVKECNEVYYQCKQMKNQSTTHKIIYGRCFETNDEWKLYNEDIETKEDWGNQVDLYISNNKIRFISFYAFGPDGAYREVYYFRENETTAFFEKDESFAAGFGVRILTKILLNTQGAIIYKDMKIYNYSNNKEIKGDIEGLTLEYPTVFKNASEFLKDLGLPYKNIRK